MRKHGWQLPYHPLQVVAIAVFMALGFAFYVFFLPFVGSKILEYAVAAIYTTLVTGVFCLYIWCAATDPGDPGVFKSKKYLNIDDNIKQSHPEVPTQGAELVSSTNKGHISTIGDNPEGNATILAKAKLSGKLEREEQPCSNMPFPVALLSCFICDQKNSHDQSSDQHISEDGMFYCSLCEVEVLKNSKHCRVCDKCVDCFDHHCRWLNNCIGRRNYWRFFLLMVFALLLLILQWSIGVLVLVLSFVQRKQFSSEITSKLGSSFSLVPFAIVVGTCTVLAMIATLPLAQLFFFHILLIKKGISTYDYIIALREQEQELEHQGADGHESPHMSSMSSVTGFSSASSFSAIHRGAWCTPPRLFLEDQLDVVAPEAGGKSISYGAKRTLPEESTRKKGAAAVKISPWALARLNAEEVSKAAAQARRNSSILHPVGRGHAPLGQGRDNSFNHGSSLTVPRTDHRRRPNKRGRIPVELPLSAFANISSVATDTSASDVRPGTSSALAMQFEGRSAFRTSRTVSSTGIVDSSPDSSFGSPDLDLHPFRLSSSGAEEVQGMKSLTSAGAGIQSCIPLSRSTSGGYEASGGEDSDQVPSRIVHRSSNWSNLIFATGQGSVMDKLRRSSSAGPGADNMPH